MEHLARHLTRARVPAGASVFEQSDAGDRFYVIAAGEADVIGDGALIRTLDKGRLIRGDRAARDVPPDRLRTARLQVWP